MNFGRFLDLSARTIRGRRRQAHRDAARKGFLRESWFLHPRIEQLERRIVLSTTLAIADNSVLEPAANGTVNLDFTVTRTGDLTSQVTVGYTTVAGTAQANTDFTPETGTTTFASGSATTTIAIPVFGNGVYNAPSLTFSVQLTGIVNEVGPAVSFTAQQTFATGSTESYPFSLAMGDLNGDGRPDLVTADQSIDTVSVFFNTTLPGATTPSFSAPQTFTTPDSPMSIALADLNGDGERDIIIASGGLTSVSVFLNTTAPGATTASFAARQDFTTGSFPTSVVVGDLNGDGKPDLVTANFGGNSVSVLVNTTKPGATTVSFAPLQTFATGVATGPHSVAIGDLNGDGKLDLAAADEGDGSVAVFLNTTATGATTASFAPQQTFAAGGYPRFVAIGDVNGDGEPDLVVASYSSATVSVLLNTTVPGANTASFALRQSFADGSVSTNVVIGDLNGDGKLDLILANSHSGNIAVLLNATMPGATTLSFNAPQTFLGNDAIFVAVGDLNGDGQPDLAVANAIPHTISVFLNTTVLGASTITPAFPQTTFGTGDRPYSVSLGDLNGDGKSDLVVTNRIGNSVSVLLNTTAPGSTVPSFANQQTFATGTSPVSVAFADVNGDGKRDLVVVNNGDNSLSVLLNQTAPGASTSSFAAQQTFATGIVPRAVVVGDVNGDGEPDLLVTNAHDGTLSVLVNTTAPGATTASFAMQQTFAIGANPILLTLGDVNGDGKPDLVANNNNGGTVSVLLNTTLPGGTTVTFAAQQTFTVGTASGSVALGDFNGDGMPDLLVSTFNLGNSGTMSVLLNTTAPGGTTLTFAARQTFATGAGSISAIAGDVNGDGKPDVVVSTGTAVSVFLNTTVPGASVPSFAAPQAFGTGTQPSVPPMAMGDVNGDGRPDLFVADTYANTVSVLLNTPVTITTGTATGTITESDPAPTVQFSLTSQSVAESATTFSLTVNLSAASGSSTSIPFTLGGTLANGTDYNNVTASPLVIPAGQTNGTITGTFLTTGASRSAKTLSVTLGSPTNAALGATTTETLTISSYVVSGSTLTVEGTAGNDQFSITGGASSFTIALNGQSNNYDPATITSVVYQGNGGSDTTTILGLQGVAAANFSPTQTTVTGNGYSYQVNGSQTVYVFGAAGDTATMNDSSSDDLFYGLPAYSILENAPTNSTPYVNEAIGFGTVNAIATSGADNAYLYDSAGNDTYTSDSTGSQIGGSGYLVHAAGFDLAYGFFFNGGTDTANVGPASGTNNYLFGTASDKANLSDSTGTDQFYAVPKFGYSFLQGAGFVDEAVNFGTISATSSAGGADTATFYDTTGNDTFNSSGSVSSLTTAGVLNQASGFATNYAFFSAGGNDTANLHAGSVRNNYVYGTAADTVNFFDSTGNDIIYGLPAYSLMNYNGGTYVSEAIGFRHVNASATAGGTDQAYLYDSPGNDAIVVGGSTATLNLATPVVAIQVNHFGSVFATRNRGGSDTQHVTAHDFVFQALGGWTNV